MIIAPLMGSQNAKKIEKKVINNSNDKIKNRNTKNVLFAKDQFSVNDESFPASASFDKLTLEEEKAIENLAAMCKSTNKNFNNRVPVLPSIEFIQSKLQCKDCSNPLEAYLVQTLIYCGYIGDYSLLNNFDRNQIPNFNKNYNLAKNVTDQNISKIDKNFTKTNKIVEKTVSATSKLVKKEKEIVTKEIIKKENHENKGEVEKNSKISKSKDKKSDEICSQEDQPKKKMKSEPESNIKLPVPENIKTRLRSRKIRDSIAILDEDDKLEKSGTEELNFTEINQNVEVEKSDKTPNTLVCPFCKNVFTSKNGLNYHIKYVHSEEKSKIIKPFVCPFPKCNKKYKNKNGLYYHLTHTHSDESEDIEALYAECIGGKKD